MDTSEIYIKMCDCPEIQKNWKPDEGDFYVPFGKDYVNGHGLVKTVNGVCVVREEKRREYLTGRIYEKLAWLPRQDQIQEMLLDNKSPDEHDKALSYFYDRSFSGHLASEYPWNQDEISYEQLWLAFYLHEKHKKKWDGEKWVKA